MPRANVSHQFLRVQPPRTPVRSFRDRNIVFAPRRADGGTKIGGRKSGGSLPASSQRRMLEESFAFALNYSVLVCACVSFMHFENVLKSDLKEAHAQMSFSSITSPLYLRVQVPRIGCRPGKGRQAGGAKRHNLPTSVSELSMVVQLPRSAVQVDPRSSKPTRAWVARTHTRVRCSPRTSRKRTLHRLNTTPAQQVSPGP